MPFFVSAPCPLQILAGALYCLDGMISVVATFKISSYQQLTKTFEPRYEKTNILVSDLVLHKLGCTAAEDG